LPQAAGTAGGPDRSDPQLTGPGPSCCVFGTFGLLASVARGAVGSSVPDTRVAGGIDRFGPEPCHAPAGRVL